MAMTHDSAVRIVVDLVPEIEKSGAASALLTHAENENLPPAQLEKLAQVFNTLKTISHIDNAAEEARGDTVEMIDVPSLITQYAGEPEKVATLPLQGAPSHDPHTVDLNRAIRMEIEPEVEKAASETQPESEPKLVISSDTVANALVELEWDLKNEISKIATDIFNGAPKTDSWERDISAYEREARYETSAEAVKQAGDWMEKFAEPHHVTLARHDYEEELSKRAFDATSQEGKIFAQLADKLETLDNVVKMATGEIDLPGVENPDADFVVDPHNPFPEDKDNEDGAQPAEAGGGLSLEEALQDGVDSGNAESAGNSTAPASEDSKVPAEAEDNGGGPEGKTQRAPKAEKDKQEKKKKGEGSKKVREAAMKPVKAVGGAVRGAASKADQILQSITSKDRRNKAQQTTDIDVADIKRAMNVQRMIAGDPVLREADPKEVLDIYNSIVEINPELAGNVPALRLVLREAVNYEGLTLDSTKQLADVRRNLGSSEAQENENTKRRYSSGGASGLTI